MGQIAEDRDRELNEVRWDVPGGGGKDVPDSGVKDMPDRRRCN